MVGIAEDAEIKSLPDTTKMLDLGKQYNVNLSQDTLTTDGEERGDWCWHVHRRTRSVKNCKPSLEWVGRGLEVDTVLGRREGSNYIMDVTVCA